MTDHESTSPAGNDSIGTDSAVGADRIDAYITSVEHVLLAARVPATERVQILGDLETQISEMLQSEPLPISDATVAAVLARLEPPSHFAATYATEPQSVPSAAPRAAVSRYNPWVIVAAGSCAALIVSFLLLMLCAAGRVAPPVAFMVLLLLLASAILVPLALRRGLAQLRTAPDQHRGQELATGTALVYWTVVPLLLLLFVSVLTDGYILIPIGLAAFAYCHYLLLRRLHHRLTNPAPEERTTRSFRDSLWRFTGLSQPTSC
jgi:hypothetical protein